MVARSIRGVGTWTDETGAEHGAVVGINVDEGAALITVGPVLDPLADQLPTRDRRIVYYVGRVEAAIRATDYRNRAITPDLKPKDRKPRRKERRG